MNLNKVLLIGNLTRDPEVRTTPGGQAVASFGMATNRIWNNQQTGQREQRTEFHNIVCWRRLAEIAGQYLKKGASVYIEGRIETRSWDDQKTGEKRYRTEIIAENLQMGPRPTAANGWQQTSGGSTESAPGQRQEAGDRNPEAAVVDLPVIQEDEPEIEVKDIPF